MRALHRHRVAHLERLDRDADAARRGDLRRRARATTRSIADDARVVDRAQVDAERARARARCWSDSVDDQHRPTVATALAGVERGPLDGEHELARGAQRVGAIAPSGSFRHVRRRRRRRRSAGAGRRSRSRCRAARPRVPSPGLARCAARRTPPAAGNRRAPERRRADPCGPRSAAANGSPSSPTSAATSSYGVNPAYTELPRQPSGNRLPSSPAHATTSSGRGGSVRPSPRCGRAPRGRRRRRTRRRMRRRRLTVSRCDPHCTGASARTPVEPREHVAGAILFDAQAGVATPSARTACARRARRR